MNMTATTMSVHAPAAPGLERLALFLLFGFVASLQLSIAGANILLAATLLCWVALLVRDHTRPSAPRFFVPLLIYAGATLLATAFSRDPLASLIDSKQLLLFLIVPLVYDLARGSRANTVVDIIIAVGAASAALGVIQYGVLQYDNLGQRPRGALGLYMTYSGVLMLVICAVVARLIFRRHERIWPALVMPALVVALSLTLSRGPWIGACVGVGLLFIIRDFRLTTLLPVAVALMFAFAPDSVTSRMMSIVDLEDSSNRDRLAMAQAGAAIIRDNPLTGVGPNMVERVYPLYRVASASHPVNPHLHNVPLQIAAERGLPALGIWIWFVVAAVIGLFRLFRSHPDRALAAGGIAAIAAMLAAGLFEYNFGDSEFLMLLLVIVTLPFAAARTTDAAATRHA
jgi:O-antigen ligase